MIARMWRGWARSAADADAYESHYRSEVLDSLQGVDGFVGARLLRRAVGDGGAPGAAGEVELTSVTFFDDLDAVRRFAGPGYEIAVVAEGARRVLSRFDEHVTHHDVAFTI
jgi:heme-degrading monooxygenase HmoA